MFLKQFIAIIASVLLILVSACTLPGGTAVVSGTNPDPAAATAAIQTQAAEIVASTAAIQTQAAVITASTAAAETALANAVAETLAAMPSNTPEFTFTPSLTPTPTFTLTPSFTPTPTFTLTPETVRVSVSVETNCRTGPGTAYDSVGVLQVGKTAEVVGRASDGGSWIIRNPANPAMNCWLWGQYATVTGNTSGLTVYTPPPTPTPAAVFNVTVVEMVTCAPEYAFTFQLANPGSVTWESIKIVVTDTVTTTIETHTRDTFKRYNGCAAGTESQNLEPGETGFSSNMLPGHFDYDPTGHAMTAVVTVCSQNALAGTCLNKTISFTP
jgi:hypothetical protein